MQITRQNAFCECAGVKSKTETSQVLSMVQYIQVSVTYPTSMSVR